jgi:hypothetical protein
VVGELQPKLGPQEILERNNDDKKGDREPVLD